MKLEQAISIAEALKADCKPFCERIEIGGSIRRQKPEVGDIELVCIPKFAEIGTGQATLFGGETTSMENLLFGHLERDYHVIKMGDKYAQVQLNLTERDEWAAEILGEDKYIKVDVFTASPETWGYIFLIRTGPAKFSKAVVTKLKRLGYRPEGGKLLRADGDELVETLDEVQVFSLLHVNYIEPSIRSHEGELG